MRGDGCPYCSSQRVDKLNCLSTIHPEIAKEWNYKKNGNLTPDKVTAGSHKRVWWKCSKGHEWVSFIFSRKRGFGCPYCNNLKKYGGNIKWKK